MWFGIFLTVRFGHRSAAPLKAEHSTSSARSGPTSSLKRQTPNWSAYLAAYGQMAGQAQSWGYRDLSIRCHIVRGIILDEYLNDPDGALQALDDAEEIHESDPSLDRARAKIFYRRRDHEAALQLFREHSEKMELREPVARAYMLREAAISAAELEQFAEAREWFAAARQVASSTASENMKLMAIGLRADEAIAAYLAGDVIAALNGLEAALDEIAPIDPASSITAGYRHRVIRHSILWLFGKATDTAVDVGGRADCRGTRHVQQPGACGPKRVGDRTGGLCAILACAGGNRERRLRWDRTAFALKSRAFERIGRPGRVLRLGEE
jgi:hypothetical protein